MVLFSTNFQRCIIISQTKKAMCELRSLFNMALSKIWQLMITDQIQIILIPEKYITFQESFLQ